MDGEKRKQYRVELEDIDRDCHQVEDRVSRFQTFVETAIQNGHMDCCEVYIDHGMCTILLAMNEWEDGFFFLFVVETRVVVLQCCQSQFLWLCRGR